MISNDLTEGAVASGRRDSSMPQRPLRILHVIPYLNKLYGGEVNACLSIVRELARRGHKVTLLTSDRNFNDEGIWIEGIEIVALPTVFNLGLINYTPDIKRWIRERADDFDVCHLHSFRTYQNISLFRLLEQCHLPFVLEAHGSIPRLGMSIAKRLFDRLWGRKILEGASQVLALNSLERDQYIEFGVPEDKVSILPNGIDLKSWDEHARNENHLPPIVDSNDRVVLLYLGRLNRIKGLDMLVDSFSIVAKACPSANLLIVGPDDGVEKEIRAAIERYGHPERVRILPPIFDDRGKIHLYKHSDIFLIPSIYDLFPITLLEAWASRLPVIATKGCGMHNEILGRGLVTEHDATDYSNAMIKLINERRLAIELGERGRATVESRYDWPKIVNGLVDLYNQSVQKNVQRNE